MNPNPEQRLQVLFNENRRLDERLAPSFERMLSNPAYAPKARAAYRIGFTGYFTAAALIILTITMGMRLHRPAGPSTIVRQLPADERLGLPANEPPAMALSAWQSPTAFLLQASDDWGQPAESPDEAPSTQPQVEDPT
jgi:hypothetical protein